MKRLLLTTLIILFALPAFAGEEDYSYSAKCESPDNFATEGDVVRVNLYFGDTDWREGEAEVFVTGEEAPKVFESLRLKQISAYKKHFIYVELRDDKELISVLVEEPISWNDTPPGPALGHVSRTDLVDNEHEITVIYNTFNCVMDWDD